ncbi:hypothetical protein CPB83DRAFT_947689, partial [Crepidotus variabilis]
GTAGCVLASRLSENAGLRVLLLESGSSGRALPFSRLPATYVKLYNFPKLVHNYFTEPQTNAGGKKKFWPRARMLGGCSSINAQMAQYGAGGDFDEWATIIGDDSWSWKNFSRYFRKFEDVQEHPDFPNIDKTRGRNGPVVVGFNNFVSGWWNLFVQAGVEAGIPLSKDFNGTDGNTIGIGRVLKRPNLTVAINSTASRVLFDTTGEKPVAVGVEFAANPEGPFYHVKANRDVVVCAGAVQSPAVLMLSGVGPATHLQEKGIAVVKDLQGVGSNLLDHPIVDTYFKHNNTVMTASYLVPQNIIQVFKLIGAVIQYHVLGRGGALASNYGEAAAFVRTDDPILFPLSEYPEKLVDSTSAKNAPDLEYFMTPSAYTDHGRAFFDVPSYSIHCYLVRPTSKGTITLNSADPFDHPIIDPKYLQTKEDLAKLVRGFRLACKIAHSEPLNSILEHTCDRSDLDHFSHLKTDAELEEIVRERVETVYHPTSTCRMAPLEDGGVVDNELKVYGIKGLRICDASIFPNIPSGHTAGACYATGEKLADIMKAELIADPAKN